MLIDTWNLLKAYVPAKDKAIVATRFVDIAMDNGIHDEEIKEMIGNDDELDEAIRYNLDLEEDDEEELYES
tara:strand:+ start:567 stop:779 length:213 start_codon:yes stop_codon:yes gene_type:complete